MKSLLLISGTIHARACGLEEHGNSYSKDDVNQSDIVSSMVLKEIVRLLQEVKENRQTDKIVEALESARIQVKDNQRRPGNARFQVKIFNAYKEWIPVLKLSVTSSQALSKPLCLTDLCFRAVEICKEKKAQREQKKEISASKENACVRKQIERAFLESSGDKIVLDKLGVRDHDVGFILKLCRGKETIRFLSLLGNKITDQGAKELLSCLELGNKGPLGQLRGIRLRRNPIESQEIHEKLSGLTAVNLIRETWLKRDRFEIDSLRSLNERELGDEGMCIVANFLQENDSISRLGTLGVAKNSIGQRGAFALAKAMLSGSELSRSISMLEVYSNLKTGKWARAFAPVIKWSTSLCSLDLGGNGIDDEGCLLIADALPDSILSELHLDYNEITQVGSLELEQVVPRSNLHTLWLHGNPLGEEYSKSTLAKSISLNRARCFPRPTTKRIRDDLSARSSRADIRDCGMIFSVSTEFGLADQIASVSVQAYKNILRNHSEMVSGQVVLSCIILETRFEGECSVLIPVSLGVGTRFVDPQVLLDYNASEHVIDSHAEVVARRGFLRFVLSQLVRAKNLESSVFEINSDDSRYSLISGARFHLYTSTAPCGAASSISLDPKRVSYKGGGSTCTQGKKFDSRLPSKSCTDKLSRWCSDGLQSKPLSTVLSDSLIPELIVVGRRFSSRCVECLPSAVGTTIRLESMFQSAERSRGDSDASYVWSLGDDQFHMYDGKTGLDPETRPMCISSWWMQQELSILTESNE